MEFLGVSGAFGGFRFSMFEFFFVFVFHGFWAFGVLGVDVFQIGSRKFRGFGGVRTAGIVSSGLGVRDSRLFCAFCG